MQNRIGGIDDAVFDYRVDVGSVRNVVQRIGIENDEISEIARGDLTNVRTGVSAEKFCGIAGCALENLHGR